MKTRLLIINLLLLVVIVLSTSCTKEKEVIYIDKSAVPTNPNDTVTKPFVRILTNTGTTMYMGDTIKVEPYSKHAYFFKWEMGDGTSYNTRKVTHFYKNSGMYQIKLIGYSHDKTKTDTTTLCVIKNPY